MKRVRPCLRIVVTLVKSFIGTGIIFLPGSFRVSGIVSGNILSTLVCILAIISIRLLVKCCQGKETLGELAERVWGRSGLILVDSSIFFSQLGFSTVYIIFVSQNIQEIIYSISSCQIEIPILKLICFQMVIYLPFIFLRDIENLGFPSVLANISVFSVLGVIIYYGVQNLERYPLARPQISRFGSIYGAGLVLGTSAFNYEGIALILPIRSSTPEYLIQAFPTIITFTMIMIGIFSNFFASFVYYSFGDDTASPVTENILNPKAKIISLIIYSSAIMFSVPLQLFPSMAIIEKYLFQIKASYMKRKTLENLNKIGSKPVPKTVEEASRKEIMEEALMITDKHEKEFSTKNIRINPTTINSVRTSKLSFSSSPLKNSENISTFQNSLFSTSKMIQLVPISENWDSPIGNKVVYSPMESSAPSRKVGTLDTKRQQKFEKRVVNEDLKGNVCNSIHGDVNNRIISKKDKKEYLDEQEIEDEGTQIVELNQNRLISSRSKFYHSVLRALVSYSLVLLCGTLAYNFEDELGSFVTITGGLLCVPIAFVYPPLFYFSLNKERISKTRRLFIGFMVFIGSVISFTSVTMAILSWETNRRNLVCIM
ncbi:ABC amino acid transporter [Cryptosporidium ubiquitum]|uniref:ABC amino acid transporter n=1 Tax=Cryptosporidium ubiquitum TaxID=857276 RepID=A0A1J4MNK8_9CRYT|nr:ABC amino acid transporter [Cryptosporidium ubiquitum]OII75043.1 ABC amino acid transporter [Cryptosporidium ubiquitum]